MSDQWHYAKGDCKHGPVDFSDLQQMASSGDLLPSDLIWEEGKSERVKAGTIDGLSFGESAKGSRKSYSFPCPHCAENIAVPPSLRNDKVTCAACSKTVAIPDRDVDESSKTEESTEKNEWLYMRGDFEHGPVDLTRLQQLASSGELLPRTLVWAEGLAGWVAASKVDELSFGAPDSPDSKSSESTTRSTNQVDAGATLWRTVKAWLPAVVVGVAALTIWLAGWDGFIQLVLLGVVVLLAYWLADEIRKHASAGNSPDKSELRGALVVFVVLIVACALTLATHWLGWRVPFLISVWTSIIAATVIAVFSILGASKVEVPSDKRGGDDVRGRFSWPKRASAFGRFFIEPVQTSRAPPRRTKQGGTRNLLQLAGERGGIRAKGTRVCLRPRTER